MQENKLDTFELKGEQAAASANTGGDKMTTAHVGNWMECIREGKKETNGTIKAAYDQATACIMVNAAVRTKQFVTFDEKNQEVVAGGKVFKY